MFTKEFDIAMPNEPMKNDFSGGAKITGTYKGPRYIKIEYNNDCLLYTSPSPRD